MDRLSFVAFAIIATTAASCGDETRSRSGRDRVNAVKVESGKRPDPTAMCDVFHAPANGPVFAWPELTTKPPAPRAGGWRWINVWATWCKPCTEELPHLATWRGRLARQGTDVALYLISADESDAEVATFRKAHPETPTSMRLADPETLPAWIRQLGVAGAGLPVHVFVGPDGRVRCVRASEIEDADYAAIEAMVVGS